MGNNKKMSVRKLARENQLLHADNQTLANNLDETRYHAWRMQITLIAALRKLTENDALVITREEWQAVVDGELAVAIEELDIEESPHVARVIYPPKGKVKRAS